MTLLRNLVLVLWWAFLCTNYSNAQDSVTGNLITNPTFSNGATNWTATGDGVGGIFAAGGVNAYNFSWQGGTVSQSIAVNQALSSTGIVVKGLQYGWQYANWCKNQIGGQQSCFEPNGPVDPLSANVTLTNSAGTSIYSQNFNYNTWAYAWRWENQDVNFTSSYAAKNLGNLTISFSGQDAGGWSGLYGPVVTNVYSRLKYGVDPCAENALSSPTCAGYFDALAKLAPKAPVVETQVAYTPPPPGPEPTPGAPPPPGSPPPNPNDSPAPGSPPPPSGSPPAPGSPSTAQQASSQQSQATAANTPQEKTSSGGGGSNVGFALSLIARNSDREKAITQQVVAQAESQAQSAGDRAQQTATATASLAAASSTSSSDTAVTGSSTQVSTSSSQSNTVVNVTAQQTISSLAQNAQGFSATTNTQQNAMLQLLIPTSIEQIQSQQNYAIFATQEVRQQETEAVTQTVSFLTDLNNPLRQILDAQQTQQTQQDQPQQTQRRDPAPNELALGVNLAQIATQPQGYGNYLNLALKDASFYEPREVYKNQKVIDNIRVLRGLGSDQKHQDLVNLQYK